MGTRAEHFDNMFASDLKVPFLPDAVCLEHDASAPPSKRVRYGENIADDLTYLHIAAEAYLDAARYGCAEPAASARAFVDAKMNPFELAADSSLWMKIERHGALPKRRARAGRIDASRAMN